MTNHAPTFTSSNATGSFTETANTTDSMTPHLVTGTMNFTDSDRSDSHTTTATLHSATVSGGTVIPAGALAHFNAAMTSSIQTDSNGSGKIKWSFSDVDDDFDFLAKNQTLVLTYDIKVFDNHGGSAIRTVTLTVTGTDDKPVISAAATATVTEQANHTLSLSPDTAHVALNFIDQDLANTGHTATVTGVSASGNTSGILPGSLGTAELMSFFDINNVVKNAGSSNGVINTTFSAPDLAFDYLAAGEQIKITYAVQLDDHAGGVSTQNVVITVIGTNDAPVYLCGPESAHLTEGQNLTPSGDLHASDELLFSDIDLSDHHTVSTTVSATRSGGGSIPLSNAALLAAFHTSVSPDSTNQLLGEVDWNFALNNGAASFLSAGETLTLTYHVKVQDGAGGFDVQDVTITILGTNHPVSITSGPQSTSVSELAGTTGSGAVDAAPTATLNFSDTDTGDTHTVAVMLTSTSGPTAPAATQADLATALAATLHDSTGTGTGSVDLNFAIADHDLDYLAEGETLTVNYNVKVSDASTNANQTVSVTITGANDAVAMTSGPESASVAEQANTTGSSTPDTASGTLNFADVDLSDTHSVSATLTSAVWSAQPDVPSQTLADLQAALLTALNDSTGTGSGGIDWTFSIPDRDLDFLNPGDTLTASYDVTVFDGSTSSTQTVTITVNGAADTAIVVNPVIASIADTALTDDGSLVAVGNLIVDGGDNGGDSGNVLSITDVNGQPVSGSLDLAATYGTLTVQSDGTYFYTANSALDALLQGQNPTETFTFTVSDTNGHSVTTTLTFNVTGSNETPTITASQPFGTMTEDAGPTALVNGSFETGDLSGWATTGGVSVQFTAIGGSFGNYSADLGGGGSLSQEVATTAGQHYTLSFDVAGTDESGGGPFSVSWDGVTVLAVGSTANGFTHYSFDVIGDATNPTTHLALSGGSNIQVDKISVESLTGPPTETAAGSISFADVDTIDTHTASITPQGSGYVGTLTLDPVIESGGSGSVGWHYTVNNSAIQFLSQGQELTQIYTVFVTDNHGASVGQDVTITIEGTNDAPTAVNDTIITDVGPNGVVIIAPWALAANDADPDTADQLFVNSVGTSTGGAAGPVFGAVGFQDDATLGGSFTYDSTDGHATSGNFATATVINNATTTTTLTGTGANEILIATQGNETLNGGGGNDILFGYDGSHVLTGGSGNDTFAFQTQPTGTNVITDFNNTSQHDHIAISANSFGGGMTAGMDTTFLFESSADDQFSGSGPQFHFDTSNQTLYYSADGTQTSVITVVQVQAGVTLNAHDLLIV